MPLRLSLGCGPPQLLRQASAAMLRNTPSMGFTSAAGTKADDVRGVRVGRLVSVCFCAFRHGVSLVIASLVRLSTAIRPDPFVERHLIGPDWTRRLARLPFTTIVNLNLPIRLTT